MSEATRHGECAPAGRDTSWFIRDAVRGDANVIAEVVAAAGIAAWGDFLGPERIESGTKRANHPADVVAVDDEGVFAFVAWDESTGEITRLYTHPRRWGHGAGRALLAHALDELRAAGRTQAWLHTEQRNERGRRFYERLGWREDGSARVRDWQGVLLREPRYVKDL